MRFIYTKTFAIFAFCLGFACLLVFMQVKGWLDPVRSILLQAPRPVVYVVKKVVVPVKTFFSTVYRLKSISEENAELTYKVASLQQNLAELQKESLENEALKKELGFYKNTSLKLVPCTVLSQNPFGIGNALVLDCGTKDGISEGQAVVSQGYLVGKITYTGGKTSTALLSVNSQFSTDAKLSKTGADAIVRGSYNSGLILDQLPQTQTVEKGWLVVTAGINEMIPKNILIGEIGQGLSSASDLFKKFTVLSPVDFNNLEFVFVAKP